MILVKTLVERKRSRRFAADDRLIGDYKIRVVDGEIRLWAEARDPYPKDQRALATGIGARLPGRHSATGWESALTRARDLLSLEAQPISGETARWLTG